MLFAPSSLCTNFISYNYLIILLVYLFSGNFLFTQKNLGKKHIFYQVI